METLQQLRQASGLSLRALAERAKMSYVAIFSIEHGREDPKLSTLKKLASALNVPLAALVGAGNGLRSRWRDERRGGKGHQKRKAPKKREKR